MPAYHARSIDVRLLVSDLTESTTSVPEQSDRLLARAQADSCREVLSHGTPLIEKFLVDQKDGMNLHFIGNDIDKVPAYIVRTKAPALPSREDRTRRLRTRNSTSHKDGHQNSESNLLATAPLALAVDIKLGDKALNTTKKFDSFAAEHPDINLDLGSVIGIRYDVFVNGNLIDSNFVDPTKEASSDGIIHVVVSGKRVDKNLERPTVFCPPGINAYGEVPEATSRNGKLSLARRWDEINAGLIKTAKEMEHWGSSSPLAGFLRAWAEIPLPEDMKVRRGQTKGITTHLAYGVVDVVLSLGRGQRANWWKHEFRTHHPLEYSTVKFAKDKLWREGDTAWYQNHIKSHIEAMQQAQKTSIETGKDVDGEDISDEEEINEKPPIRQTKFRTETPSQLLTITSRTQKFSMTAVSEFDSAPTKSRSGEAEEKPMGPPPALVSRGRGRPRGSKTKKRQSGDDNAIFSNPAKYNPSIGITEPMKDKLSEIIAVTTEPVRKQARITVPSTVYRTRAESHLSSSHYQTHDKEQSSKKVSVQDYLFNLKEEWTEPRLCSNSALTFAKDGIWGSSGRVDAKGGHLRHVRERRAAKFDDEDVVFAVRFIVG